VSEESGGPELLLASEELDGQEQQALILSELALFLSEVLELLALIPLVVVLLDGDKEKQ